MGVKYGVKEQREIHTGEGPPFHFQCTGGCVGDIWGLCGYAYHFIGLDSRVFSRSQSHPRGCEREV